MKIRYFSRLSIILLVSFFFNCFTSKEVRVNQYKERTNIKTSIHRIVSSVEEESVIPKLEFFINMSVNNSNEESVELKSYTIKIFFPKINNSSAMLEETITQGEFIANNKTFNTKKTIKLLWDKINEESAKQIKKHIFNIVNGKGNLEVISLIEFNFHSNSYGDYSKQYTSEEQVKIEIN